MRRQLKYNTHYLVEKKYFDSSIIKQVLLLPAADLSEQWLSKAQAAVDNGLLDSNHPRYLQNHGAFLALLGIFKRFNAMHEFKLDLENSDIDMKLILDKKNIPDIFCTGKDDEIMIPIDKEDWLSYTIYNKKYIQLAPPAVFDVKEINGKKCFDIFNKLEEEEEEIEKKTSRNNFKKKNLYCVIILNPIMYRVSNYIMV